MSINSIIDQIREYSEILDRGELSPDQIAKMTELSHELYERLVIFRYKSLELGAPSHEPEHKEDNPDEKDLNVVFEPEQSHEEDEIATNQISLIDSIEEIKEMEQSLNESFSTIGPSSITQQFQGARIEDLKSAITINQRFKFISDLFENDSEAFSKAIDTINEFTSFLEADDYVENTLKTRYSWEAKSPTLEELSDLISRRFL